MGIRWSDVDRPRGWFGPSPNERDKEDPEAGEAPETPLDEPRPPRVEDPPPQPGQKGPYVVQPGSDNFTEV